MVCWSNWLMPSWLTAQSRRTQDGTAAALAPSGAEERCNLIRPAGTFLFEAAERRPAKHEWSLLVLWGICPRYRLGDTFGGGGCSPFFVNGSFNEHISVSSELSNLQHTDLRVESTRKRTGRSRELLEKPHCLCRKTSRTTTPHQSRWHKRRRRAGRSIRRHLRSLCSVRGSSPLRARPAPPPLSGSLRLWVSYLSVSLPPESAR
jgi:hypothetical protein